MIDIEQEYKTREGLKVIGLQVKEFNDCGSKVTFPVKGSIIKKYCSPRYQIWTMDGKTDLFNDHPDDLKLIG